MKLKLVFCFLFVLVVRCMKKGFLLNKQKDKKQQPKQKEPIEDKTSSFECDICIEKRFVSFVPPCQHPICGVCVSRILHRQNLDDACAICRTEISKLMKAYKFNFHNFDDLNPEEYLPASQSAIFEGKLTLLQKIVNLGFDVSCDPVLILQAVENGHLQILKFLVEQRANLHIVLENVNLVFIAADCGHFGIVKFLVDQGVDMNIRNNQMETPILRALFKCYYKIIKFLADRGSIMNQPQPPEINLKLSTSLYMAAQEGQLTTVKFLVAHGVDVNRENPTINSVPIIVASAQGHLDIVKFLARNGADIDPVGEDGATPLYYAVYEGRFDVVKFLVDQGADVNKPHKSGATPTEIAIGRMDVSESHQEVAIYLAKLSNFSQMVFGKAQPILNFKKE